MAERLVRRAEDRRWAYVEANDVQLPDEYDQIVSAVSDWIAIAARGG